MLQKDSFGRAEIATSNGKATIKINRFFLLNIFVIGFIISILVI